MGSGRDRRRLLGDPGVLLLDDRSTAGTRGSPGCARCCGGWPPTAGRSSSQPSDGRDGADRRPPGGDRPGPAAGRHQHAGALRRGSRRHPGAVAALGAAAATAGGHGGADRAGGGRALAGGGDRTRPRSAASPAGISSSCTALSAACLLEEVYWPCRQRGGEAGMTGGRLRPVRPGFSDVLRSEASKLWTMRSAWWTLAAMAAGILGVAVFVGATRACSPTTPCSGAASPGRPSG